MAKPETLNNVKLALRVSHSVLDSDITADVDACLADLRVCGVQESKLDVTQELDPLVLNAVKLYCKKEYTDDTVKAARYQGGYDALKSCLMMAEGYGYEEAASDE